MGTLLDDAAKQYLEINQKYPTKARRPERFALSGTILQKRGSVPEALDCFLPLLEQQDSPDEFRKLKTRP